VDSQLKLHVVGLLATWRSVCILQMNRVNCGNNFDDDDSNINVIVLISFFINGHSLKIAMYPSLRTCTDRRHSVTDVQSCPMTVSNTCYATGLASGSE